MGQIAEVECNEACVKNEALRGWGTRIGAWALGAEASVEKNEVEKE